MIGDFEKTGELPAMSESGAPESGSPESDAGQ